MARLWRVHPLGIQLKIINIIPIHCSAVLSDKGVLTSGPVDFSEEIALKYSSKVNGGQEALASITQEIGRAHV